MEKKNIKQILRNVAFKVLKTKEYSPIVSTKNVFKKRKIFNVVGGDLNPDKNFYIIQRHPGYGIFSNLTFVINHIKIALDMGFIPIVDMENYTTIYNEKKKIFNTFNSWEYYYDQISTYSLEEVYKSKNIVITDNIFYSNIDFKYNITDSKELLNIFHKHIKVKKNKLKAIKFLKKKLFKNQKILGVHFRGTGYKGAKNPFPLTVNQMINKINEILSKDHYDKIFLMTEDENNFKAVKKYFGEKVIYLNTTVRGKTNQEVFDKYTRDRHRYKLGRDVLFETYLLSFCDGFFDIETNPRTISIALNLNPNQKRYTFDNGYNDVWPILNFLNPTWALKSYLPEKFGGFKNNHKPIKKIN